MKFRIFLALELSQTVRNKLSAHAELISANDKLQQVRWLQKENFHLTLSFLGNVENVLISSLQLKLEQILNSKQAVPFRFSEIIYITLSQHAKKTKLQQGMPRVDIQAE